MKTAFLLPLILCVALAVGGCDSSLFERRLPERVKSAMETVRDDLSKVETMNPKDLEEANRRIANLRDSFKQLELVWPAGEYSSEHIELTRTVGGYAIYADTFSAGYPESDTVTDFAMTLDDAGRTQITRLYRAIAGGGHEAQVALARAAMEETSAYRARTGLEAILDGKAKK